MKTIRRKWDLIIFLMGISAAALYLRYLNVPFESADYTYFLSRWYRDIKESGGFRAIGQVVGNYTPPYMYLMALMTCLPISDLAAIKLFSVLFDVVLAVFMGLIVRRISKSDTYALMAYTAALFLPAVFLNSSVWGQCDSIYVSFLIMSLYYLLKEKSISSMVCFGLAFSFKLQAIFFLPVVILAALKGKIKLWSPALAVLTYLASGLPAVIAGMHISDAYGVYFLQTGQYPQLSMNAPNLYQWFAQLNSGAGNSAFSASLVCFAFGTVGCAMLPLYKRKLRTDNDLVWITLAVFFAALMPFVLPHMHERYWYFSDILALLLIFCKPQRWYASLALMLPSLYAVCCYLFGNDPAGLSLMALMMLAGICLVGAQLYDLVQNPAESTCRSEAGSADSPAGQSK